MKYLNKILPVAILAATMIPFASCDKDNDSDGGAIPGGKQLAKVTYVNVEERLDNGDWMTEDYNENGTEIIWSGNRVTAFRSIGSGESEEQTFSYDSKGHITQVTGPDGTYTPTYDENGRIVKTTRKRVREDGEQREVYYTYTYNSSGNIIKLYVTRSYNSNWEKYSYTWENGNVVQIDEEEFYDGYTYSFSDTLTYDNKVNFYSCLPTDVLLASGGNFGPYLSRNNILDEEETYTYSGDYLVKREYIYESGTRRRIQTTYIEYTDGTGRR